MAQKERELKYELSESAHGRLLELCEPLGELREFSNLYFQAEEPVERKDWVFRLRRQGDGEGELTLKIGRELAPGMFSSTEYTARVKGAEPETWEGTEPYRVFLQEISSRPPRLQGASHNRRHLLKAAIGPVESWELDRTTLPDDSVLYELEIEWEPDTDPSIEEVSAFREELEQWLESSGLGPARPSRKTKYRRFLDALASP